MHPLLLDTYLRALQSSIFAIHYIENKINQIQTYMTTNIFIVARDSVFDSSI
jgi:hypothetical protein